MNWESWWAPIQRRQDAQDAQVRMQRLQDTFVRPYSSPFGSINQQIDDAKFANPSAYLQMQQYRQPYVLHNNFGPSPPSPFGQQQQPQQPYGMQRAAQRQTPGWLPTVPNIEAAQVYKPIQF